MTDLENTMAELVGPDGVGFSFDGIIDEIEDQRKTDTKATRNSFFKVNDIVLLRLHSSAQAIGIVSEINPNSDMITCIYYKFPNDYTDTPPWSAPKLTHINNVRWIGDLERFGLSWPTKF